MTDCLCCAARESMFMKLYAQMTQQGQAKPADTASFTSLLPASSSSLPANKKKNINPAKAGQMTQLLKGKLMVSDSVPILPECVLLFYYSGFAALIA